MTRFKALGLAIILYFLIGSPSARADYVPLKLYQMILKADRIIYGRIISLDSSTYTLQPIWSYDGKTEPVVIRKFRDWSCAQRWAEYQTGQTVFLFLESGSDMLQGMSPGNEHELPVWRDSVYISERSLVRASNSEEAAVAADDPRYTGAIKTESYMIYDHSYIGYRTDLQKFILTVKNIRECFYYADGDLSSRCDAPVLQRMALKDRIFRWTLHESQKCYFIK